MKIKFLWPYIPSLATCLIGACLLFAGLEMPNPRGWASAPGLFPVIIGGVLVLLGLALLAETRALQNDSLFRDSVRAFPHGFLIPFSVIMALALYITSLRYLPFEPVTFVFLCVMMLGFRERSIWKIGLAAGLFTIVIPLMFTQILGTLLPGTYSIIETLLY